ncbi:MAG TPA: FtsX-like permease family protein, partial [Sphingobacteriaceae bacterium]|nr:FtsX-like permease family protein [Sphingobacteriaceae bacterium]
NMSGVSASSYAGFLPVANSSRSDFSLSMDAVPNEHNMFSTQIWNIDYDYIPTLGINLVEGRNFSVEFGTDSMGIIINETAAGLLGMDNPVGKKLYMPQGGGNTIAYTVLGVVENFHYESLRQHIGPLCMRLGNNKWATAFKVSATDIQTLLGDIESEWKSRSPEMPFTYHFMDESFDAMYRAEQRAGNVALAFSVLAIIIACLGLFGLTTYMVEQRTKEIGIRKVLGASVSGIVSMLSRDFVKLVLIAIVIATPLAWWAMSKWLQDFAYRIDIQWWMLALAGLFAVLIALITVGWQAIRAALANPVESLRDE